MTMQGIDISDHQAGIDIAALPDLDFVVVKATEGRGYTSPTWREQARATLDAGCLLGLYHFARNDLGGDTRAEDEATYFVNEIEDYLGKTVLVLDWEVGDLGEVAWVKRWVDTVLELTDVQPMVYMSEWPARNFDWSPVSSYVPLWCAKYADDVVDYGWNSDNPGPAPNVPAWEWWIWQWTSKGRLPGYSGNLDLNLSRLTKKEWVNMTTPVQDVIVECATPEMLIEVGTQLRSELRSWGGDINDKLAEVTSRLDRMLQLLGGIPDAPALRTIVEEELVKALAEIPELIRTELDAPRKVTVELGATIEGTQ